MRIYHWALLIASMSPSMALGADINNGRDIAQRQCSPCHIIEPHQRREVAIAPPFDVIGRKSGFDADLLAYALLEPHPKMNFAPSRREAIDVAAYISTHAKKPDLHRLRRE